jgi:hypothetical protein
MTLTQLTLMDSEATAEAPERHFLADLRRALGSDYVLENPATKISGITTWWACDIALPRERVIIQLDSDASHLSTLAQDIIQTLDLTLAGWTLIRIRPAAFGAVTTRDVLYPAEPYLPDVLRALYEQLTPRLSA